MLGFVLYRKRVWHHVKSNANLLHGVSQRGRVLDNVPEEQGDERGEAVEAGGPG